jgi:hypothetical protein
MRPGSIRVGRLLANIVDGCAKQHCSPVEVTSRYASASVSVMPTRRVMDRPQVRG